MFHGAPVFPHSQWKRVSLLNKLGKLCSLILLISQMLSKPRESLSIGSCRTSLCISQVNFMAEAFFCSIAGARDPSLPCCGACSWTHILKQHNMKKLYGTKNNCMYTQLGQILDKRYKETKNPTAVFEEAGAKTVRQEGK